MRGFAIKEIGKTGWVEKDKPQIGPLDALVRPLVISPCTSDIHSMHGGSGPVTPDRIMGHEAVGEVVEIGSMVNDFKVGDVVAVPCVTPNWLAPGVQGSRTSSHDRGPMQSFKYLAQVDGTMAEFFPVPQADANMAIIPEGVSLEAALMTVDMMSTGFWGAENANIHYGDTVVVMGIGPVGLMAVAGSQLLGAGRIIAIGTRPNCVKIAREYGASDIVSYKDGDLVKQIYGLTGNGVEAVILAGGNGKSFQEGVRMLKAKGTLSNINYFDVTDKLCLDTLDWGLGMADKHITGGFCIGGRVRMEKMMAMIKYGRIDPTKLITHTFKGFDQIPAACQMMDEKPADLIKPIVYLN